MPKAKAKRVRERVRWSVRDILVRNDERVGYVEHMGRRWFWWRDDIVFGDGGFAPTRAIARKALLAACKEK